MVIYYVEGAFNTRAKLNLIENVHFETNSFYHRISDAEWRIIETQIADCNLATAHLVRRNLKSKQVESRARNRRKKLTSKSLVLDFEICTLMVGFEVQSIAK